MKAPDSNRAESNASNKRSSAVPTHFIGTNNPRHLRVIHTLLHRPLTREQLDSVAGASNGPELVADLRRLGLDLPCERITFPDRDDKPCHPGVYSLTATDCRKIREWKRKAKAEADKGNAARTAAQFKLRQLPLDW